LAIASELLVISIDGVVRELVIKTLVADRGSKFRRVAEPIFPDLHEELVEELAARGEVRCLGESRRDRDEQAEEKCEKGAEFHLRTGYRVRRAANQES
jgi:hypothetical protein